MSTLFEAVQEFFDNEGWATEPVDDVTALRMDYQGKHGAWPCYARVREKQGTVAFYAQCPFPVPDERRLAVAEFLTRANYGTVIGNFELDLADGDLRYKTSLELGPELEVDEVPTFAKLYGRMVGASLKMMDQYLPGITAVVAGDEPAAAVAAVEK